MMGYARLEPGSTLPNHPGLSDIHINLTCLQTSTI